MSDRLQELLRQRALLQEHLAWLDREIAAVAPEPLARPKPAPAPAAAPGSPPASYLATQAAAIARHTAAHRAAASAPTAGENPVVAATADAILEEYRVAPATLKTDVRQGCLLYFVVGLAACGALVAVLYFLLTARGSAH